MRWKHVVGSTVPCFRIRSFPSVIDGSQDIHKKPFLELMQRLARQSHETNSGTSRGVGPDYLPRRTNERASFREIEAQLQLVFALQWGRSLNGHPVFADVKNFAKFGGSSRGFVQGRIGRTVRSVAHGVPALSCDSKLL